MHDRLTFSMVVAGSRVLGESVRKIAISSRAALAVVRQGHGKPLTQLELHTTLWQLYLRQEVVHTAHFNPSGVDSWALLLVCPQPWPACSSPHWLPAAARIPNLSLWQPPWSFFLNKPVHNNWELGRADNYFFFWDKISPAALVAKNGRGEVPDDLQYLRELHAKGVRWIGDEGTHVGALLPHFLRSALVRDRSLRTGPAPTQHAETGSAFSRRRWELRCARTMPCKAWNQLWSYHTSSSRKNFEAWLLQNLSQVRDVQQPMHKVEKGRWAGGQKGIGVN